MRVRREPKATSLIAGAEDPLARHRQNAYVTGMRRYRNRRPGRIRKLIPWLLSFAVIGAGAFGHWSTDEIEVSGTAILSDGDSFRIGDREIRLFGVDAFEIGQTCRIGAQSYDCGVAARSALRTLIRDTIRCRGDTHDRYDRLIAVCFTGDMEINAALVARGHALADRRYSRDYVDDERRAKIARAGAWAGEFQAPWEYRTSD